MRSKAANILLSATMILAAGCGGSGSSSAGTITNPGTGGTSTVPVSTTAVAVSDFSFDPSAITVAAGSTVTWTWDANSSQHTVTFDDGVASAVLGANAKYSRTFNTAGTFSYHCAIHSSMRGSVVVK